jgi:hypothetical protein
LQESDRIRRSVKADGRVQPEVTQPNHVVERLRERNEAPDVRGGANRPDTLADSFQNIDDLMANLAAILIVGMEA